MVNDDCKCDCKPRKKKEQKYDKEKIVNFLWVPFIVAVTVVTVVTVVVQQLRQRKNGAVGETTQEINA